jgi:hypothetical protein
MSYGVAASPFLAYHTKRISAMLCDAVKARWDSDILGNFGAIW